MSRKVIPLIRFCVVCLFHVVGMARAMDQRYSGLSVCQRFILINYSGAGSGLDTICPIPSDMICPTPLIFGGETWDVLCHWMRRECHAWQLYFSAVTLLPRQTKAICGKVEIDYFGVSLRHFSGGEALAGGQVRRGGLDGKSFYTGTEAQDAMVCDGPTGRDDGWCGVAS